MQSLSARLSRSYLPYESPLLIPRSVTSLSLLIVPYNFWGTVRNKKILHQPNMIAESRKGICFTTPYLYLCHVYTCCMFLFLIFLFFLLFSTVLSLSPVCHWRSHQYVCLIVAAVFGSFFWWSSCLSCRFSLSVKFISL